MRPQGKRLLLRTQVTLLLFSLSFLSLFYWRGKEVAFAFALASDPAFAFALLLLVVACLFCVLAVEFEFVPCATASCTTGQWE